MTKRSMNDNDPAKLLEQVTRDVEGEDGQLRALADAIASKVALCCN